jgi:Fur family ferric uptake transcriptional regulator
MPAQPEAVAGSRLDQSQVMAYLRAKGFRMTTQRQQVVDIFFDLPEGEHLSAEDLHRMLQDCCEGISLATAYRTLKLLASAGVLRELDFAEDHKHYELIRNPQEAPHHHIICVECGGTDEFESPQAFQLAVSLASSRHFQLTDVQLKLFGVCAPCQAKQPASLKLRLNTTAIH